MMYLINSFLPKVYQKVLTNCKVGPVLLLSMQPFRNKPSIKPTTTVEDVQEVVAPIVSPGSSDRVATLRQRIEALEQKKREAVQQEVSTSTATTESSNTSEPSQQVVEDSFSSVSETSEEFYSYSTTANEEIISSAPQDIQTGEAIQAAFDAVSDSVESISFWDPIMGFFFGSTLAGLATVGFLIGGVFFTFRGRLNRETAQNIFSFFRNNRLLSSAIFGTSTGGVLIHQNGTFNWAELQRRIQVFITWASGQNTTASSGFRMPSIFTSNNNNNVKKDGKDEEEDKDIKDPFSGV